VEKDGAGKSVTTLHSLRAGLASSAEVDERHIQKQLGHASAEMTADISGDGIVSESI